MTVSAGRYMPDDIELEECELHAFNTIPTPIRRSMSQPDWAAYMLRRRQEWEAFWQRKYAASWEVREGKYYPKPKPAPAAPVSNARP